MSAAPPVAGLLLAAGAGTRFGGGKALARLDGEALVVRAARVLAEGGCAPVLVVLGAEAADVAAALAGTGARTVLAPDWATGMGASLRTGLAALADVPVGACVVALADQPRVGPEAVVRLRQAHEAGAVAAVATYGGRPRNPVLLGRPVWGQVATAAQGDTGARPWLRAHPDLVTPVPCDDTGSPTDVDTPADLDALEAPA